MDGARGPFRVDPPVPLLAGRAPHGPGRDGRHDRPGGAGSLGRPDDPGAEPRAGLPGDAAPRGGDRGHGTRADAKGEHRRDRPRSRGEREYRARAPRPHRRQEPAGPTRSDRRLRALVPRRRQARLGGGSPARRAERDRFPAPRPRGNPGHGIGEGGRRHRGDPQPREGDLPSAGGGEGDGRHRKPVSADGFAGSRGSRKGPRRARRGRRRPDADAPLRRARPVGAHGRRAARERARAALGDEKPVRPRRPAGEQRRARGETSRVSGK